MLWYRIKNAFLIFLVILFFFFEIFLKEFDLANNLPLTIAHPIHVVVKSKSQQASVELGHCLEKWSVFILPLIMVMPLKRSREQTQ